MIDLGELMKKAEAAKACNDIRGPANELGPYMHAIGDPSVVLELIERVEKVEAIANAEGVARDRWELESSVQKSRADEQEDENDRIRDLMARAGEALKPFADEANNADAKHDATWFGRAADTFKYTWVAKLGDFRAARTVAAEIEKEIGND